MSHTHTLGGRIRNKRAPRAAHQEQWQASGHGGQRSPCDHTHSRQGRQRRTAPPWEAASQRAPGEGKPRALVFSAHKADALGRRQDSDHHARPSGTPSANHSRALDPPSGHPRPRKHEEPASTHRHVPSTGATVEGPLSGADRYVHTTSVLTASRGGSALRSETGCRHTLGKGPQKQD